MAEWSRILLPMQETQETWARSLGQEELEFQAQDSIINKIRVSPTLTTVGFPEESSARDTEQPEGPSNVDPVLPRMEDLGWDLILPLDS